MPTNQSGCRLITQNLLAAAALHESKNQRATWETVRDLSVFINVFCLYDRLEVMGRQAYSMIPKENSEFHGALRDVIRVSDVKNKEVLAAACAHLVAFLGEGRSVEEYVPLFHWMQRPDAVERGYSSLPDGPVEVENGKVWLQTLPDKGDIVAELNREPALHRSVTFLARSFIYLAQADASGVALTSDGARSVVFETVDGEERALRAQLLRKIGETFLDSRLGDEFNLTRDITPLAAIVIDRASPHRSNIPREMVRLRDELTTLRARLRTAEEELFSGTRDNEVAAYRKWKAVFDEIEREFGKGDHLLTTSGVLGFAEGVAGAALKPKEPKGWFQLLSLPVDIVRRILSRRTIIELHRLRSQLPASENLRRKTEWLLA
jgi:hypothetical protein